MASKRLTKTQIVKNISKEVEASKDLIELVVDSFLDQIAGGVREGRPVYIDNFGIFSYKTPRSRKIHSLITGDLEVQTERKSVRFKPAKKLRETIA